jgi:outer membrane protein assembly factor BamB
MTRTLNHCLAACLILPALAWAGEADAPVQPELQTPAGDYQAYWLDLQGGGSPARVFLALRDGTPVQFWSLVKALPGLPKEQGNAKLLVDALRGKGNAGAISAQIDLRLTSIWNPMARTGMGTLNVDLKAQGATISGTWALGEAKGQARGALLDAKALTIAAGQDWPSFYGSVSAMRGPDYGKPLIDDLAKARPLWRSEAGCLSGWGTGTDSRYPIRAGYGSLCGGSGSPVAADGRIFLFHFRPPAEGKPSEELMQKVGEHPVEREGVIRMFAERADTVLTCLDARDGHLLWESVWPKAQANIQTHKWRGNNPTPAVALGVVVFADYAWNLTAVEAASGKQLWRQAGGGGGHNSASIGPVISGDTVVWKGKGLDLKTGTERWAGPAGREARRMLIDGKERVLLVGQPLIVVDPVDGSEVARGDFPGSRQDKRGKPDPGKGLGANLVCEGPWIASFETMEGAGGGRVVGLKVVGAKVEQAWASEVVKPMEDGHIALTIADGKVFTAFQEGGGYAFDLQTGQTVRNLPDHCAHSNPIFAAVDKRLLWQPECQHGTQHIQFIDAATFTPMGAIWSPPHNDTTAYGEMPTANLIIDGRLIIRGMDGLYCYDLRP